MLQNGAEVGVNVGGRGGCAKDKQLQIDSNGAIGIGDSGSSNSSDSSGGSDGFREKRSVFFHFTQKHVDVLNKL